MFCGMLVLDVSIELRLMCEELYGSHAANSDFRHWSLPMTVVTSHCRVSSRHREDFRIQCNAVPRDVGQAAPWSGKYRGRCLASNSTC